MSVLSDPSAIGVTVTPSDTVNLTGGRTRGLFIGTSGNLSVLMDNGTVLFTGVVGGNVYPFRVKRVNETDTTASNIVALY